MIKSIIVNPFTIWLKFLIFKFTNHFKYSSLNLELGYLSYFENCNFGLYNTLYDHVFLSNVTMGDCTYVANNTKILNANIGKYCSIACDVLIGLGKHPVNNFVSTHPIFFSTLKQAQITFAKTSHYNEFDTINIGNDVWIGARAIIVDGISVGDGAIIGAGAVVTRNVPAYAIVGGVPAKIIKYRFTEKEIIYLQDFCWWDRDIKWLRDNHMILHDIKKFMSM